MKNNINWKEIRDRIHKDNINKQCWNCKNFGGYFYDEITFTCKVLGNNQTWDFEGDNCEYFEGDRKTNEKRSKMNIFKVWGIRNRILLTSKTEIDLLTVKKDCFCSTHSHLTKINKFYVVDGCFEIETPFGTKILNTGESFTVEPPMVHRFKALEDSVVIELAYVIDGIIDEKDINRIKQGGRIINGTEFTLDEIEKQGLK